MRRTDGMFDGQFPEDEDPSVEDVYAMTYPEPIDWDAELSDLLEEEAE